MEKSWEQIIGGYATNTLTEEEKRQLFEAALDDQTLFDALADEEALKALLEDPESRQRILNSLQASGNPQETTNPHRPWFGWFRQPSSMAWAGSIAAVGLALIFGWQMEKTWGPIFEEELQTKRPVSEDKKELATRSQPSRIAASKTQAQDVPKTFERKSKAFAPKPAPIPRKEQSIAQALQDTESMDQVPSQIPHTRISRQEVKNEPRVKAKDSAPPIPQTAFVQKEQESKKSMAPALEDTAAREEHIQKSTKVPAFADQMQKRDSLSSMSARELFYRNKSELADTPKPAGGMQSQRPLGRLSSKIEGELEEKISGLRETPRESLETSMILTRGLHYRFLERTQDGKHVAIDLAQFSGNWADLQLVIESNVSGYLYVLTSFEKGKWQSMSPKPLDILRSSDEAIKIKSYESVNFALSQLSNVQGKPAASFVTVLLSSIPITNLGDWLGKENLQKHFVERFGEAPGQDVFIIDPTSDPEKPFRVDIPLP